MRIWWLFPVLVLAVARSGFPAELVVIASDDPSLKAGAVVDGSQPIKIPAGARVTLISSAGKTIVLEGPYDDRPDPTPAPAEGDLVESLSRLVTQEERSSTALAVARTVDKTPDGRPDLWGIDIAHAGSYCLRGDVPVFLWWDAARAGAIVSLSDAADSSRQVRIRWPSPKRHLAWPGTLALADGATYIARFRSGDEGERLLVLFMPKLASDPHRIAWMAEHGCIGQALNVLDALAEGEL